MCPCLGWRTGGKGFRPGKVQLLNINLKHCTPSDLAVLSVPMQFIQLAVHALLTMHILSLLNLIKYIPAYMKEIRELHAAHAVHLILCV